MQALGAVTYADLAGAGQTTLRKFEVYDGAAWIDLAHFHEALTDGGLEDWASATNLTSWGESIGGTSTVNRDAAEVHGGTYSARLDVDASNTLVSITQTDVVLRRGFTYCFSGWYKTEAEKTAQVYIYNSGVADIRLQDDMTWGTGVNFLELAAATAWTQFKYYFTPHPAYTNYNVALLRNDAASSSIWFDDISIEAVPNDLVKSLSLQLGGAGATPDPVAADWSAELHNELGLFHPAHPYSDVNDLLRVGRQVRISYGGTFIKFPYPFSAWERRKKITLPLPDSDLDEFPLMVPIVADADLGAWCLTTGYDIRFAAADGTTELPYERVSFSVVDAEATGVFRVECSPRVAGTHIYLYYGNPDATDVSTSITVPFANRLTDGGFEAWTSPTNLTSWDEQGSQNQEAAEKIEGDYSCRGDKVLAEACAPYQHIALESLKSYVARVWYKTAAGKSLRGFMYVKIGGVFHRLQADGTWSAAGTSYYANDLLETEWTEHTKIFTTPAGLDVGPGLWGAGHEGSGGPFSYYIDDACLFGPFDSESEAKFGHTNEFEADGGLTWGAEEYPTAPTYEHYWQRLIGYMDAPTFDSAAKTVSLSGSDYCKPLVDTALRFPYNYWGATETCSSVASFTESGGQLYDYADALDPDTEFDLINAVWTTADVHSLFVSVDDGGGVYYGKYSEDDGGSGWVSCTVIASLTADARYIFKVNYRTPLAGGFTFELAQMVSGVRRVISSWAAQSASGFVTDVRNFIAPVAGGLEFKIIGDSLGICYMEIDWVSLKAGLTNWNDYPMPAACNGPYYATLDGEVVSYGAPVAKDGTGGGYFYDEGTRNFYFSEDKTVEAGTDNLLISYYTDQVPENVVADILAAGPNDAGGGAGLYANRAAALAAMDYVATGITLEKVWFADGNSGLRAIREICERCNYRFWFTGAGVPTFRPALVMGDPILWLDTDTKSGLSTLQDLGEIRNNVVLQGIEQAMFKVGDEVDKSRLKATASDATSIAAYLEHSYAVTSNLFQDQASLTAAAAAMLAAFKDPKWYATLAVPHNPVPLELGDTVGLEIPLAPGSGTVAALDVGTRGIIRDVSLSDEGFSYKVELESGLMNIANYTTAAVTVTAEQCKGWMLTNAGAAADVQFNLPAATVGMWIRFFVQAAQTLTVNPSGTERIAVLTDTAGDYLRSDAVIGSYVVLGCLAAGVWSKLDISGTWTEEA